MSKKKAEPRKEETKAGSEELPVGRHVMRKQSGKIRSAYDGQVVKCVTVCGEGKTKQCFKDECDIERIVSQFKATGITHHVSARSPVFMDVSDAPDYRTALESVNRARELFYELGSEIRAQFENDEIAFVDWLATADREELSEIGIMPLESEFEALAGEPVASPDGAGQAARQSSASESTAEKVEEKIQSINKENGG